MIKVGHLADWPVSGRFFSTHGNIHSILAAWEQVCGMVELLAETSIKVAKESN